MFFLLYYSFKDIELGETINILTNISFFWLIIYILCFYLGNIVRAIRWKYMIKSIKSDVSVLNLFGSTMIGYGVNCVLPRFGELYRPSFLGKWEGLSRTSMFGTIIIERIIDILLLGISVIISGYLYNGDLFNEMPVLLPALYFSAVVLAILIVIIYFVVKLKEKFYNLILKIIRKVSVKLSEKLADIFATLVEGFGSINSNKLAFRIVLYSVLITIIYTMNSLIGFYMLNLNNQTEVTFGMAFIVMSIGSFGIVIPTPGGTGSYHALMIIILTILGFSKEEAAAYAISTHFITYIAFILTTFWSLWYINKKMDDNRKANFVNVLKID